MAMGKVTKSFKVTLDIARSISNREFSVVEGDTGNTLSITLNYDGKAVDLNGCRVLALFSKSNGETVCQDSAEQNGGVTIGGQSMNEISIELFASSVAPGMVESEIQVYSGSDLTTLVTSAQFNFKCRRGILNGDTLAATREYPLLTALIKETQAMQARLEAMLSQNEAIAAAEKERASAEAIRRQAEKQRVSSETLRNNAEAGRSTAESGRRSAETARVNEFNSIKAQAEALIAELEAAKGGA